MMTSGPIPQENMKSIYIFHTGAPKCIKQILTDSKGEIDSNTIRVGEFNTLLSIMDKSSKRKSIRK